MYVDDSGTQDQSDSTTHYVIAGVIVHEYDLTDVEERVRQYKLHNFSGDYQDEEIHVHEIYKSRGKFVNLTLARKY